MLSAASKAETHRVGLLFEGATALSMMTFSIITASITTLSIMTFGIIISKM
jgi:hypothetical protein